MKITEKQIPYKKTLQMWLVEFVENVKKISVACSILAKIVKNHANGRYPLDNFIRSKWKQNEQKMRPVRGWIQCIRAPLCARNHYLPLWSWAEEENRMRKAEKKTWKTKHTKNDKKKVKLMYQLKLFKSQQNSA